MSSKQIHWGDQKAVELSDLQNVNFCTNNMASLYLISKRPTQPHMQVPGWTLLQSIGKQNRIGSRTRQQYSDYYSRILFIVHGLCQRAESRLRASILPFDDSILRSCICHFGSVKHAYRYIHIFHALTLNYIHDYQLYLSMHNDYILKSLAQSYMKDPLSCTN